jgi:hypothetical protein
MLRTPARRIAVDLTHLGPRGVNGGAGLVVTTPVREWALLAPHTEFVLLMLNDRVANAESLRTSHTGDRR